MNERIEQCLYQAGLTAQGCWDNLDDYTKQGIEKFAESIVYDILNELTNDDGLGSARIVTIQRLAERYGVAR